MVVFFHPNWNFEELGEYDASNFERRAPFPTISLLRKDDIGLIVNDLLAKEPPIFISQKINEDNTRTLAAKGFASLTSLMKNIRATGKAL